MPNSVYQLLPSANDHLILTCINDMFPNMMLQQESLFSSSPQLAFRTIHKYFYIYSSILTLTAVDSRDARVISRFPFNPNNAGTTIYNSETSSNSFQCYIKKIEIFHVNFMRGQLLASTTSSKSPAKTQPSPANRNGKDTCSNIILIELESTEGWKAHRSAP